ncbi:CheR family methyltransferase [Alteromonas sp. ASW11-130]|uniref:CheR family methyltransferase n=1 Tax=Alteromonas sp. ASW11-130 TaxID=3015775 RepID=UPI003FA4B264
MGIEFGYTKENFDAVRTLLYKLTGIKLVESKDKMVYSRLSRRIRQLGLHSFDEYLQVIKNEKDETEEFVNALTTNLTSFFRESHHFDFLKEFLQENSQPLTIWCAASSSGEEPYSIAMTCIDARGSINHNISVMASDIDSRMLEKAKRGEYPLTAINTVSDGYLKAFFDRGKGTNAGNVRVKPAVARTVKFFRQNLLDPKWQIKKKIDVVFCRNVMIYFDKPTQAQLLKKFSTYLAPNGIYIAGHSEGFSQLTNDYKSIGRTIYQVKEQR